MYTFITAISNILNIFYVKLNKRTKLKYNLSYMDCVEMLYTGNHFMFFLSNLDMISVHGGIKIKFSGRQILMWTAHSLCNPSFFEGTCMQIDRQADSAEYSLAVAE
jgi:hypothetical protein